MPNNTPTNPTRRPFFLLLSLTATASASRMHSHVVVATYTRARITSLRRPLVNRCAFSSVPNRQRHPKRSFSAVDNHPPSLSACTDHETHSTFLPIQAKFLPESQWRRDAALHAERMRALLSPGLNVHTGTRSSLDPRHPIYNFLIEYYGIKGSKGVNRLMRWCPTPCFVDSHQSQKEDTIRLNVSFATNVISTCSPSSSSMIVSGVFLENASMQDIASGTLHLRGATFIQQYNNVTGILYCPKLYFGQKDATLVLGTKTDVDGENASRMPKKAASAFLWYRTLLRNTLRSDPILYCHGMHEWAMLYNPDLSSPPPPSSKYQSHLSLRISQQVINEQVERKGVRCTHIDALRFFAPEARKWNWYGSLEDLSEEEWKSGMLAKKNVKKHLSSMRGAKEDHENEVESIPQSSATVLTRTDQLHLEQKACLHANMDLFKIAWRLQPFLSSTLLAEALSVALQARTLDVEASPYDVSDYVGLCWNEDMKNADSSSSIGIPRGTRPLGAVKVETEEGRKEYQWRQAEVMRRGEIVRKKLLQAYNDFLNGVFEIDDDELGEFYNAVRGQKIQESNPEQSLSDSVHLN